jgi:hypothetical protein
VRVKYNGVGKSSDSWKVDRHMAEILREIFYSKRILSF